MVSPEQRIALALQACLESIQAGDDSFDSALARFPELEEELRPQLENALWLVSSRALLEPDADFVPRSRARLMARIQAEQRATLLHSNGAHAATRSAAPARATGEGGVRRPPPPVPGPSSWMGNLLAMFRLSPALVRVAVTLGVVLALLIGADRVVENTQAAIPGEAGYSIKRTVEDLALAVSADPGQHVVLNLEYSQRRVSETALLVEKSRFKDASNTLQEYEENVRGAVASLGAIEDRDTVHKELLAMTIQDKLDNTTEQLASLLPRVPEEVKPSVTRAMTVSTSGMAVAATTIDRLMILRTPTPDDLRLTPMPGDFSGDPLGSPTAESMIIIFTTPTEEFRQIFSSTASGPVTEPTRAPDQLIMPTLPPPAATATPLPTYEEELPTPVPTMPQPTRTPTATSFVRTPTPVESQSPTPNTLNNQSVPAQDATPTPTAIPN